MTRRSTPDNGHIHPDSWTKEDHNRYEDRVTSDLKAVEKAVQILTTRLTLMLGGLGIIAFLLPVIAPFVRAFLNVDPPPGQ